MNRLVCISCEDFMMDNRTPEFIKIDMDKFEEFYDEGGLHKPIPRDRLLLVDHKKIKNMYETVGFEFCYYCACITLCLGIFDYI